jgi:DEAD/DEAH box helicase domain-containing protein
VSWGRLQVTEKVTGYQKVNNFTRKTISTEPLDLPEQVIETEGLWIDLQERFRQQAEEQRMHFMGAIHAIEHAMIAMFPLVILCDRNDIGGISCPHHEQTGLASIFIYDGFTGGAGLSEEAYGIIDTLLLQTEKTITGCPCESGCPTCVHSPKCGSGNRPIDKAASLYILQKMLSTTPGSAYNDSDKLPSLSLPDMQSVIQSHRLITTSRQDDHPAGIEALPSHYCVFDLETKFSAQEVGGWGRADRMGMSVGVVFDSELDGHVTYLEEDAAQMVEHLSNCQLIIGFNNKRFDNQVLSAYSDINLHEHASLDLLEEIHTRLGYRLSLGRLAEQTLGAAKSADGLQALKWYKEGKIKEIVYYCKKDVEITRDLLLFGLENGFLLFKNKAGSIVRLPLSLDARITEILS